MTPCEFNLTISSLACAIAKGKSQEELSLLACFFTQLGDSLATIGAANNCFCDNDTTNNSKNSTEDEFSPL